MRYYLKPIFSQNPASAVRQTAAVSQPAQLEPIEALLNSLPVDSFTALQNDSTGLPYIFSDALPQFQDWFRAEARPQSAPAAQPASVQTPGVGTSVSHGHMNQSHLVPEIFEDARPEIRNWFIEMDQDNVKAEPARDAQAGNLGTSRSSLGVAPSRVITTYDKPRGAGQDADHVDFFSSDLFSRTQGQGNTTITSGNLPGSAFHAGGALDEHRRHDQHTHGRLY